VISMFFAAALAASTPAPTSDDELVCRAISELGGTMMQMRQDGLVSQADMEVKTRELARDAQFAKLYISMVRLAWSHPQFNSPQYRQTAVMRFKNEMYSLCLEP